MHRIQSHWLTTSLIVLAAVLAACAGESPLGVDRVQRTDGGVLAARDADRAPELGACGKLQAPAGMRLAYHVYAKGVQIYRWDGAEWRFVAPVAQLYADAGYEALVGRHYRGPKWESLAGDVVSGAVLERCDVPGTIQWLLLQATGDDRAGVFQHVERIQRLNTAGGTAPSGRGSYVGEEKESAYTAEYFFYR